MGKGKLDLTIIILAGNEAEVISKAISSSLFASEIIIVLANSTDETRSLAKKILPPSSSVITVNDSYGRNFAHWRNLGLQKARGDWVLYLDADEEISTALSKEILSIINKPNYSYYVIPRQNYFLGKKVRFGGTYPDYVKRLYRRLDLTGWKGYLHEEPIISGNFGYIDQPLLHYTHRNLSSMIKKSLIWTDMEAQALYDNHHPPVVWWRFLRMMFTKLFNRLIIQQMWRDGIVGWISSIYESFDTFIIYARLWELQQQKCQK